MVTPGSNKASFQNSSNRSCATVTSTSQSVAVIFAVILTSSGKIPNQIKLCHASGKSSRKKLRLRLKQASKRVSFLLRRRIPSKISKRAISELRAWFNSAQDLPLAIRAAAKSKAIGKYPSVFASFFASSISPASNCLSKRLVKSLSDCVSLIRSREYNLAPISSAISARRVVIIT